MSEFKVNTITNRDGSYGPQVCGITTFGGSGIQLPSGPTEVRGGRGRGVIHGGRENPTFYADMDFIEIAESPEVSDNVDFVVICGQLTIAKDTYAYYQAFCKKHTGRNFRLFVLNEDKKRNSKKPLYKEKFKLDLYELEKFNDYIASL